MNARRTDLALGGAAIVLSAGWLIEVGRIPDSLLSDSVGAGGLPRLLGWAAGAIGVLLCARGLLARALNGASPAGPNDRRPRLRGDRLGGDAGHRASAHPHLRALGLLAILAAYVALAPWLGYAVATGLLLAAAASYAGAPRDRQLVLVPVAAGLLFWLLFVVAFGIPMPGSALFAGT
jgi:hypothetical protein